MALDKAAGPVRRTRAVPASVIALIAAAVGALAGIYLLFNSQTLSAAERSWCDQHMSQVALAAMQVNPRPSGVIGEALAEHGARQAYWEDGPRAAHLSQLWRSTDPDSFNRACKFAVGFARDRDR